MTEASTARPRRRWKYLLIFFGALVVLALGGLWYINTDSFQSYVRRRVVQEIERITGGRAEVGSFHVVPFHLQVEVRNITVHGKEDPADIPLVHADSLLAQLKVISLARTEFGFNNVTLDHPLVHIAIAADGTTTNIPGLAVQTPIPVRGPRRSPAVLTQPIRVLTLHLSALWSAATCENCNSAESCEKATSVMVDVSNEGTFETLELTIFI